MRSRCAVEGAKSSPKIEKWLYFFPGGFKGQKRRGSLYCLAGNREVLADLMKNNFDLVLIYLKPQVILSSIPFVAHIFSLYPCKQTSIDQLFQKIALLEDQANFSFGVSIVVFHRHF